MLKFQCLIDGKYVQKFEARLKKSVIGENDQYRILNVQCLISVLRKGKSITLARNRVLNLGLGRAAGLVIRLGCK
jgi:hypothetical protein